jgi:ABC-type phosphate/phosphonate transport system substrate-binding protein
VEKMNTLMTSLKTLYIGTLFFFCFFQISANTLAYDGEIDFSYHGGAYLMDKSGVENDTITQFWEILLKKSKIKRDKVKVKNFVNEDELYSMMKKKSVIMAGVSHSFFHKYETELGLEPLVVPTIGDQAYIYYCVIVRNDGSIKSGSDLNGKKISIPAYGDEWYFKKLLPENGPESFEAVKFPDQNSVVTAVLYKKVDAGVSSEQYLENFLALRPHLENKVKILMKTKKLLIPPIVFQKERLTDEEKEGIIAALLEARNDDELVFLLDLIGFSGFQKITREKIIEGVK